MVLVLFVVLLVGYSNYDTPGDIISSGLVMSIIKNKYSDNDHIDGISSAGDQERRVVPKADDHFNEIFPQPAVKETDKKLSSDLNEMTTTVRYPKISGKRNPINNNRNTENIIRITDDINRKDNHQVPTPNNEVTSARDTSDDQADKQHMSNVKVGITTASKNADVKLGTELHRKGKLNDVAAQNKKFEVMKTSNTDEQRDPHVITQISTVNKSVTANTKNDDVKMEQPELQKADVNNVDTPVPRIKNTIQKKTFLKESNDICTFELFRTANRETGYFPSGGNWHMKNGISHYQPEICKYKYPRVPPDFINKCFLKANITYVLNMGDSIGIRYCGGMERASGFFCEDVRREERQEDDKFMPDISYYKHRIPQNISRFVKTKFRYCATCASYLKTCRPRSRDPAFNYTVDFEHLSQTMILDDTLQIEYASYFGAMEHIDKIWGLTMPEIIMRYYLPGNFPGLCIIYLPFAHAKLNVQLERLAMEIEYFKGLLELYFPKSTKFFFFPLYREVETARRNSSYWTNHRFQGMLASEKIEKMNRILYDVLSRDFLDHQSNVHGFLDVFEASRGRGFLSLDGVHMQNGWYESIASMFWETYCNSVLLDKF